MSTKIDYSKKEFSPEEKQTMLNESAVLKEKYPNHIPVLIQLHSNVLKIDKNKFIVSEEIKVNDYFNTLKKKLENLDPSDSLLIYTSKLGSGNLKETLIEKVDSKKTIKEFYEENKDPETNMLIFTISRQTTYKWAKSTVSYLLGYKK